MAAVSSETVRSDSLFALLRWIEARTPEFPRLGKSLRSREDPLRLGNSPDMSFAPTELADVNRASDGRYIVRSFSHGLFGPNGPMPLHMTEHVWDRLHNHGDSCLRDFADIFNHRFACLLYRAWADAQPVTSFDRAGRSGFGAHVAALAGYDSAPMQDRDALSDNFKLRHAGQLSRRVRSAHELGVLMRHYLGVPARVQEYAFGYLSLDEDSTSRLGARNVVLGQTTVLGNRVPDVQSGFLIMLGPMPQEDYDRFAPEARLLAEIRDLVYNWLDATYGWSLCLSIETRTARRLQLGRGVRLGFDSWIPPVSELPDSMSGIRYQSTRRFSGAAGR